MPMCPHLATGRKRPFWRTKLSKTTVFPQPGIMTRLSAMIILLAIDQLLRISFNASCKLSGACLLVLENSHQIYQQPMEHYYHALMSDLFAGRFFNIFNNQVSSYSSSPSLFVHQLPSSINDAASYLPDYCLVQYHTYCHHYRSLQ